MGQQSTIDIFGLKVEDIFTNNRLNMEIIEQLRKHPEVNQELIDKIINNHQQIQEKLAEYQNLQNKQKQHSKQKAIHDTQAGNKILHWSHNESLLFVRAVEQCGKNNDEITRFLQQRGVRKDKRQVVSHAQKFFKKLSKYLQANTRFTRQQLQLFCADKVNDAFTREHTATRPQPNMLQPHQVAEVLRKIMIIDQVTMGSLQLALREYCNNEQANTYHLNADNIVYLIINYAQYLPE